jgi:hypothetical protein
VDDFIITGSSSNILQQVVSATRTHASTTTPALDPAAVLGIELERNKINKTISLTMRNKIMSLGKSIGIESEDQHISLPLPPHGYIIRSDDIQCMKDKMELSLQEKSEYLRMVGSLIWISGVRPDILFATMYLSWNTRSPLVHHQRMARHCIQYLVNTAYMPMVLGGEIPKEGLHVQAFTDASLGTAPKGKSVIAHLVKVQETSASIITKAKATTNVYLSSFESELDGYIVATRSVQRMKNIIELRIQLQHTATIYWDNLALVEFIKGEGEPLTTYPR